MEHFVCTGECGGASDHAKNCEAEVCSMKGKPMAKCNCTDQQHQEVKENKNPL